MAIDVYAMNDRKRNNPWDRVSIGDVFTRLTASYPDNEALIAWKGAFAYPENERLTYRQFEEKANQFAHALIAHGLKQGDRVYFFSHNSSEGFIAKLGVAKAGMVAVPVNVRSADDVIAYTLNLVEPSFIICDDEYIKRFKVILAQNDLKLDLTIPISGEKIGGIATFNGFISQQPTTPPQVEIHGDDIWEILFTSGTTSLPKGAMMSHHSTYFAGLNFDLNISRNLKYEGNVIACDFFPVMYHIGDHNAPLAAWFSGGKFVFGRKFSVANLCEAATQEKATFVMFANARTAEKIIKCYDADPDKYDFSHITTITYSEGLDFSLYLKLKKMTTDSLSVWTHLAQTECIAGWTFEVDRHLAAYLGHGAFRDYVGKPCPLLEAKLVDENGEAVTEPNVLGEAVYRSPIMFSGYYKKEKETQAAFKDGWFHSGDILAYDEHGLAYFVDRKKDVIKTGGENVSSGRVQSVLRSHETVDDAAVVGLPHQEWGEAVTAFVTLNRGQTATEDELKLYARQHLAGFETPKRIIIVEEFPRSSSGKIQKYQLRADAKQLYNE